MQNDTLVPLLHGRKALVTGAASGIGLATSRRLAQAGAEVALLSRRHERLTVLADELNDAEPAGRAVAVSLDVTDAGSVQRAVDAVHHQLGAPDVVVNAAGIMLPNSLTEEATEARLADWERMIATNLTGALRVTAAFLPDLQAAAGRRPGADVVNISSIGAHLNFPRFGVYGATKAELSHLSASRRSDLAGSGVRVTNVEPGLTHSELADHVTDATSRDQLELMFTAFEALDADDVADLILYTVGRPARVNLRQVVITPTGQP
jgi:NADP-dependent 3-hydroxy acid dehydrogenase YdfG